MKISNKIALKVCPILALIFSVIVTATTMYINEGISPVLIFTSIQVYLNWYCIYSISRNATTMKSTGRTEKNVAVSIDDKPDQSTTRVKYWYCEECCYYTYKPTQHCGPCKKCFHFRDHHCFFIGGCILRQNMGNFILICFYTSYACLYSLLIIGPYLYSSLSNRIAESNNEIWSTILNFCFPVALARLLIIGENTNILLVLLFDTLFSVSCMCFLYGTWKLYLCLTGRQRYYPQVAIKQNFNEIFGSYGVWNVIFPYNGLLGTRDIDGKYVLKEV